MNQDSSSVHARLEARLSASPKGAVFSSDCRYRYLLWRVWAGTEGLVLFVGLNPSTADEQTDDPTMRRCKSFAESWGATGFLVANLFAYRATKPTDLYAASTPIGTATDNWIDTASSLAGLTIACWGNHGTYRDRATRVLPLLRNPHCLRMTKVGHPSHPLYLPGSCQPMPMAPPTS